MVIGLKTKGIIRLDKNDKIAVQKTGCGARIKVVVQERMAVHSEGKI